MRVNSAADWSAALAILGARRHYIEARVLANAGRLERLYTDYYLPSGGWGALLRRTLQHLPWAICRRAATRHAVGLPDRLVVPLNFLGVLYALALQVAWGRAERERINALFGSWFGQAAARRGFGRAAVVVGVNTASVEWFTAAHRGGLACVLDQCSAPYTIYDQLLAEEYQLWPDWEVDSVPHRHRLLSQRERREWELADGIICGSQFVADGLVAEGVERSKCLIVPSGVDIAVYSGARTQRSPGRLRVLFLGKVSITKGIQYLFQALEMLADDGLEVQAAGGITVNAAAQARLRSRMKLLGLQSRNVVPSLLRWADVLVLPTICEGSALVTYEALVAGVPVITTPNAGSPVNDGVTGFIVPHRSAAAVAERLEWLRRNPNMLREMSVAAQQYAMAHFSWEAYGHRLLLAIGSVLR